VNKSDILAKVRDCIADTLDQPNLAVTLRTTAEDVQGWDSFNHVNIVLAIEAQFGISFHTAEVEELRSVGEIVKLVDEKLAEKA
jgi:acyl carrier protein